MQTQLQAQPQLVLFKLATAQDEAEILAAGLTAGDLAEAETTDCT